MSSKRRAITIHRFQPTYEELKLRPARLWRTFMEGFQPTYEELKREYLPAMRATPLCFQPTYEELKPGQANQVQVSECGVSSLPMRN